MLIGRHGLSTRRLQPNHFFASRSDKRNSKKQKTIMHSARAYVGGLILFFYSFGFCCFSSHQTGIEWLEERCYDDILMCVAMLSLTQLLVLSCVNIHSLIIIITVICRVHRMIIEFFLPLAIFCYMISHQTLFVSSNSLLCWWQFTFTIPVGFSLRAGKMNKKNLCTAYTRVPCVLTLNRVE